jgi:hypothetical protein
MKKPHPEDGAFSYGSFGRVERIRSTNAPAFEPNREAVSLKGRNTPKGVSG